MVNKPSQVPKSQQIPQTKKYKTAQPNGETQVKGGDIEELFRELPSNEKA
jgi:hypothetical protein